MAKVNVDEKPSCARCQYDSRRHEFIRSASYKLVRIR